MTKDFKNSKKIKGSNFSFTEGKKRNIWPIIIDWLFYGMVNGINKRIDSSSLQLSSVKIIPIILLLLLMGQGLYAATYTTIKNGNWNSGSIWDVGSAPSNWANHDVVINHNINVPSALKGFTSIYLNSSTSFTASGNMTFTNIADFTANGNIVINGDLTLESTQLTINSGNLIVTGKINVKYGSTLTIADGVTVTTADFDVSNNSDAVVNLYGTANVSSAMKIQGVFNVGSTGILNVPNGDVNINEGSGTLHVDGIANLGGTVDVNRSYGLEISPSGNVTVGQDLLIEGGAHSAVIDGSINVANDISVKGGSANITGVGVMAWGNTLTISGGSANINGFTSVSSSSPLDLSTMSTVLPITLKKFTADVNDNKIILNWITAAELNNDFFTVQRSGDGENFESIGVVKGKGTTNEEQVYDLEDKNPNIGYSYYRLKQTDLDGTTEIFKPVTVFFNGEQTTKLAISPNPVIGDQFDIILSGIPVDQTIQYEITDMNGQKIDGGTFMPDGFSMQKETVEIENELHRGIYFVSVIVKGKKYTARLLKI